MTAKTTQLSLFPKQRQVAEKIQKYARSGHIFHVWGRSGLGRTTLLRHLNARFGGSFISSREFVESAERRHPLALDEAFYEMLLKRLQRDRWVIVDDFPAITEPMTGRAYPRAGLLDSRLAAILQYVEENDRRLIIGTDGYLPNPLRRVSYSFELERFDASHYQFLCRAFLNDQDFEIDFDKLHRFAPELNAHQLKKTCRRCRRNGDLSLDALIDYIREQQMGGNVDLEEVANVSLQDLIGVDSVIKELETHVIVPLENDDLATRYDLKAKRGVLLTGPPGTGKTTIGRALAHRLKGKFLLVDGTVIAGTGDFYYHISKIFHAALESAPSVIFFDDGDVIFQQGREQGLYRYLLTQLDGLAGESAKRVCVMMTAMNIGDLPPALVRSGRIELWLEMQLPNDAARETILHRQLEGLPEPFQKIEVPAIVAATDGMTGADLNRIVEDGKSRFAYDQVNQFPSSSVTSYFLDAARRLKLDKEAYEIAHQQTSRSQTHPIMEEVLSADSY